MAYVQVTLNNVAYFRNEGSGGVDVVIGNLRRTTWTRSTDGAMSTGTYRGVAGRVSLIVEGELSEELFRELEGRYEARKLAH
jgi:hypothetical protein